MIDPAPYINDLVPFKTFPDSVSRRPGSAPVPLAKKLESRVSPLRPDIRNVMIFDVMFDGNAFEGG